MVAPPSTGPRMAGPPPPPAPLRFIMPMPARRAPIPTGARAVAGAPASEPEGGVCDVGRQFGGADARWAAVSEGEAER